MLNSLVELVEVGIGIAQSTFSSRADELVALTVELVEIGHCLVPLVQLSVAKTGIEVGQIARVGTTVVARDADETRIAGTVAVESLIELLCVEIVLAFRDGSTCLFLARSLDIVVVNNDTYDNYYYSYHYADDSLLVLQEECFGIVERLFHWGGALRVLGACHYFYKISVFKLRGKITEFIAYIEIYYQLFSFLTDKTRNFALKSQLSQSMILQKLSIINYKNIKTATLEMSPKMNCLIGHNGAGKTNVLDAIYYMSFCRSAHNPIDSQIIRHQQDFFVLEGDYATDEGEPESVYCGMKRGTKKHFKRNKKEYKRLSEHIGLIPIVVVSPSDTLLIEGGSEERRRLMDMVISQYDHGYMEALGRYNKALQQRNSMLKMEAEPEPDIMDIWEEQMAAEGELLYRKRDCFVRELIPIFQNYYRNISSDRETVGLNYVSHCQRGPLLDVIRRDRHKDRAVGYSLHGVHRDDLEFTLDGHPMKREGSQGQNKTFVIALKLAQFDFLRRTNSSTTPLLLLDDIFDKLDAERVEKIVRLVAGDDFGQIFITDTNREHLGQILQNCSHDYKLFQVEDGEITEKNV